MMSHVRYNIMSPRTVSIWDACTDRKMFHNFALLTFFSICQDI